MKTYFDEERLIIEADEGMMLTDGAELFAREYAFPEGVETNETIREITEAEYNAIQEAAEAMGMPDIG